MYLLPERSYSTLDYIHCVDALSLLRALADKSVDAIITDMPYGQTACAWDTPIDLVQWWVQVKRVLKPRGVFVTTGSQPFTSNLVMSNPAWFKYEWVVNKRKASSFLDAPRKPLKVHESVVVFSERRARYFPQMRKGELHHRGRGFNKAAVYHDYKILPVRYNDEYYPQSIIEFSFADTTEQLHPTQKPVALYEYLIQTYTRPGELVLDPFSGSGTTAMAARKTGRHFICGDSSAEYVAMSRKRLATTDPYLDRRVTPELTQKSMFAGMSV